MDSFTKSLKHYLTSPFIHKNKLHKTLLLMFVLINCIVLFNAVFHFPRVGYDGYSHLKYVRKLADRIPIKGDTSEYFSPPLPYFFPSRVYRLCRDTDINEEWGNISVEPCLFVAGKAAQLQNVILSLLLTFYLLKICELIYPGNVHFKLTALGLLGMLPVYYKTFAFLRGEPVVAAIGLFASYEALTMMADKETFRPLKATVLGLALGLLMLSRQWSLSILLATVLFVGIVLSKYGQRAWAFVKGISLSFVIALVTGGWFYVLQFVRYGTATPFNRDPASVWSLANQPLEFYLGTGWRQLFTTPVRPYFPNQLIPIFYSEIWGDYWGYFVVTPDNTNSISHYLGRVNLFSLVPTLLFLAGGVLGFLYLKRFLRSRTDDDPKASIFSFFLLSIVLGFAGYLWFLVRYPEPEQGDTIKATYLLQVLIYLPLFASELLERLRPRNRRLYVAVLVVLALIFVHNLPVIITRYITL